MEYRYTFTRNFIIVDDEIGIQFVREIKSSLRIEFLRVACIKVHAYRV